MTPFTLPAGTSMFSRSPHGWFFALLSATLAGSCLTAAAFDTWKQVEDSQQSRDYMGQIIEGKFGDAERRFVTDTVVPQLGLESNRPLIAATRLRIRDLVVRGAKDAKMVDAVNTVLLGAATSLARDDSAELVTRINAILLVGEMLDIGRRPWPGAVAELAALAGDGKQPLAIRVAAVAGLSRYADAAGEAPGPLVAAAGPAIAGIVTSPPSGDPVGVDWLVSRALILLPKFAPPPAAVVAAAKLLTDTKRPVDTRVRAAAAVGAVSGPVPGLDAVAAVDQVRLLAIAALEADLAEAAARRKSLQLGGVDQLGGLGRGAEGFAPSQLEAGGFPAAAGGFPDQGAGFGAGQPGGPTAAFDPLAVPPLAVRRDAWRLATLAEAVKPQSGGPGLADRLDAAAAATAKSLAETLAAEAGKLDQTPDEPALEAALVELRKTSPVAGVATDPGGSTPKPQPAGPGRNPEPDGSPVGQPNGPAPSPPAEESPFGAGPSA